MNPASNEKMPGVFQNRNFVLVFLGALVSNIGAMLYSFAVSYYILEITGNNAFLQGLYLGLIGILFIVVSPFGGAISDRLDKAKIMYGCDYAKGAVILAATLILLANRGNDSLALVVLFVAGAAGNIIGAVFSPASSSILPRIVRADQLQQANSYFSMLQSVQTIAGILLAGVLYAALPVTTIFFIVGGCYVASAISEMFIRYDHTPHGGPITVRSTLEDIGEGVKYLWGQKALLALGVAILFINFFTSPLISNFLPYFIVTDVAPREYMFRELVSPEMWQSIFTVFFGVGGLLGGMVISRMKQRERCYPMVRGGLLADLVLLLGLLAGYIAFVVLGGGINPFLIILCALHFLIGVTMIFINIPVNTSVQLLTDKRMLGKVNSVITVFSQGLIPLASMLAGAVLDTLGSTWLLGISVAGFLTITLLFSLNKDARAV